MKQSDCEFCKGSGGEVIWRDAQCRIVRVDDADYPGFCRVIWNDHVREMTDLSAAARHHLMTTVFAVEQALRETLQPLKINLASLGNVTPHVHWHVIPRFQDDRHFPNPIWGTPQRESPTRKLPGDWVQQFLVQFSGYCSMKRAQNTESGK